MSCGLAALVLAWAGGAAANNTTITTQVTGPFTAGNVVVYRVGSGSGSLLDTGNPVFLDEYTPSGTLVQSVAMPTTVTGANRRLVASGIATGEGELTRSADGQFLVATGYDAAIPYSSGLPGTSASAVARTVARIAYDGTVDTSTALTDSGSDGGIKSAVTHDGSAFWFAAASGLRYAALGSVAGSTPLNASSFNYRQIQIYQNQLYVSAGSAVRIGSVGIGLPATSGQSVTGLPGLPASTGSYAYFLADLNTGIPGVDTLYVADESNGLQKYSWVGGTWVANGTIGGSSDSYRGVTGSVSGSVVTLFATKKGGNSASGGGQLVKWVDSGGYNAAFNGSPTGLANAANNTAYRGVALAPSLPLSAPVITTPPASQSIAGGGTATLSVSAAGNPAPSYQWYLGLIGDVSSPVSGATASTFTTPALSLSASYWVRATNSQGTADSDTATIHVAMELTTQAADGLIATSANLHGTVNPHDKGTVFFQYGPTADYGNQSVSQDVSGSSPLNVTATLVALTPGTTYHYRLVGVAGGITAYGGDGIFTVPAAAPVAVTGNPVAVSATGATLLGAINPNGLPAQARFLYGLTPLYGSSTPMRDIAAGTSLVNLTEAISGLIPGATYHGCIIATTTAGITQGTDVAFIATTGGSGTGIPTAVPSVTTNGSAVADSNTVELLGTVNPFGGTTVAWFEYGMTTSYGQTTGLQGIGNGTAPVAVSVLADGLLPATLYHFRLLATNSLGTAAGADAQFTTAAAAPTVVTGVANVLNTTSASVTGTVRAHGMAAQVFVDYGTSATALSNSIAAAPASVSGDATTTVGATLTGLFQGTTYYYQIRAVNAGGTARGSIMTFDVGSLSGLFHWFPDPVIAADRQGSLTVNLTPSGIGGGWRLEGERNWRASGSTASGLTSGDRLIQYRDVPGYQPLSDDNVTITSTGIGTTLVKAYSVSGSSGSGALTVTLQPISLSGTQWRFSGESDAQWKNSGVTVSGLVAGDYLIECMALSGRTTPPSATATVANGKTTLATLVYQLAETNGGTPPAVLTFDMISNQQNMPFAYAGQITSDAGSATGFVVKARVVATAGHVVFDDVTLAATTGVRWFFQQQSGVHEPVPLTPRGFYLMSGYAAQRAAENTPGTSLPASQNLDAAAIYFQQDAGRGGYSGYFASDSTVNEYLVSTAMKTLVGYPLDGIAPANQGCMHATPPTDVTFASAYGQTYTTADITSSGGNSGGPLCVQHPSGIYYPAAIYLGGSSQMVVRAIDSAVSALFQSAETSGGSGSGMAITSASSVAGIRGQPLAYQISATDTPISYSLSGSLPPGMVLHGASGLIDGTPQSAGIFTVAVAAASSHDVATLAVTFKCLPDLVAQGVTTVVGQPLSYAIVSSESGYGVTYTATGLPAGLSLDGASGVISGAAMSTGNYQVPVSVAVSGVVATAPLTLTVVNPVPTFGLQPVASRDVQYGTSTTLTALASISLTANTTLAYQWYQGLSGDTTHPVAGATAPTFVTPPVTAGVSYWVRATSASGTSADSTATTITVVSSTNADLSNLTPSQGTLSPAFNPGIYAYTLSIPFADSISIKPDVLVAQSSVTVNGIAVPSGSFGTPIPFAGSATTISVDVTSGDRNTTTHYTITVARGAPPAAVTSSPATNVSQLSATLNGSVIPNGTVSAYFQYLGPVGTTYQYTPVQLLSGTSAVPVQAALSGLTSMGSYHFQLVVLAGSDLFYGEDMMFTINKLPEAATGTPVVTLLPGNTPPYRVVLAGAVNPLGQNTEVHFLFKDNLMSNYVTTQSLYFANTSTVDVTTDATTLINPSATRYDCRIVATNSTGSSQGEEVSFTLTGSGGTGGAPLAVTGAASAITVSAATLQGQVNPNGKSTFAYFEYGPTTAYGSATARESKGNGNTLTSVTQSATGLLPGTLYHYHCVAENGSATSTGADATFTTGYLPPLAITGTAAALSTTSVKVTGFVQANGATSAASFEFGTDGVTFPNAVAAVENPVTGTANTPVSAVLTGLSSGVTYWFRARADSPGGTAYGSAVAAQPNALLGYVQSFTSELTAGDYQGQVQVTLQPGTGGWRFIGETQWRASGTTAAGLTTGDRQIEYQPLAGLIQPPSETVGVVSGDPPLVLNRSYFDSAVVGDLIGVLKPDAYTGLDVPVASRAQWRMVGDTSADWRNSGDAITGLWPGTYVIECKGIPGFATPAPTTVMVQAGNTSQATVTYVTQGSAPPPALAYLSGTAGVGNLYVQLLPAGAVTDGGRWRLAGDSTAAWHGSGETLAGILPGSYLVECMPVSGRTTPTPLKVFVQAGQTTATTITYFTAMSTTVNLQPVSFATASTSQSLPYGYVGILRGGTGGSYSGFVVKPQVVATVAQAVFDEATLAATSGLQWLLQVDSDQFQPLPQIPRGYYALSGYAAQRSAEGTPGTLAAASQNLDVAALYFDQPAGRAGFSGYLATTTADLSSNPYLQSASSKTLVGYPIQGVPTAEIGQMHATSPVVAAFTMAYGQTYINPGIQGVEGMLGGPLCVQYQGGTYYPAGIYVGGDSGSTVRAIDSDATALFTSAALSANGGNNDTSGGITHSSFSVIGSPSDPGAIKVTILPAGACAAGAGWRLSPEVSYRASAIQKNGLAAGYYVLQLRTVTGYQDPAPQSVQVIAGQLHDITFTYQENYTPLELWRLAHFGTASNTGNAADTADPDGDGSPNLNEYAAGTDPTDPKERPRILTATKGPSTFTITADGKATHTYTLERTTTPATGPWTSVATFGPLGADGSVTLTDPAAPAGSAFYRLRVELP